MWPETDELDFGYVSCYESVWPKALAMKMTASMRKKVLSWTTKANLSIDAQALE